MRNQQQPAPGVTQLFTGISKRLDDARSALENMVPQSRGMAPFATGLPSLRLPSLPQRQARRVSPAEPQPEQRSSGRVVLRSGRFAALIPGDGVVEQVFTSGLNNFLSLYNAALIVRLILTWFPSPPQQLVGPLSTITDPYLNLFRGIIPPLGGTIDLSPILAFIVLDVFTNSAAALPCEMSADGKPVTRSRQKAWTPGKSVVAWRQRLAAQRAQQRALRARQAQKAQQ